MSQGCQLGSSVPTMLGFSWGKGVFRMVSDGQASTGIDGVGKQICKSPGTGIGNLNLCL